MGLRHGEGHGVEVVEFFAVAKKKSNIPAQVYAKSAKEHKGEKGQICVRKKDLQNQ